MTNETLEYLETLSSSKNYNAWLYHNVKDWLGQNILDIGSGIGSIAQHFAKGNNRTVTLSETSEDVLNSLIHKFKNSKNFYTIKLDITKKVDEITIPQKNIDTITCINVLEHLKDDVTALKNMSQLLSNNGKVILIVPAIPLIFGTLDTSVGHYRRYTKNTLNKVLKSSGFLVEKQYYMNFLGIFSWFLAGRILNQKKFSKTGCKFLDKLVPFLEKLEQNWKPPIGQSLVTICSKVK